MHAEFTYSLISKGVSTVAFMIPLPLLWAHRPNIYRSERHMVARIVSKHVIELDIVDFVGSLCLESLQNDGILLIGNLHAEVVED